jgi:hypothetical protein
LGGINNGIKTLITEAEQQEMGYVKFLSQLLETEVTYRSVKDLNKREKQQGYLRCQNRLRD